MSTAGSDRDREETDAGKGPVTIRQDQKEPPVMDSRIGDISLGHAPQAPGRPVSVRPLSSATVQRTLASLSVLMAGLGMLSVPVYAQSAGYGGLLVVLLATLLFERLAHGFDLYEAYRVGAGFRLLLATGLAVSVIAAGMVLLLVLQESAAVPGWEDIPIRAAGGTWAALAVAGLAASHALAPLLALSLPGKAGGGGIGLVGHADALRGFLDGQAGPVRRGQPVSVLTLGEGSVTGPGANGSGDLDGFIERLRERRVATVYICSGPNRLTDSLAVAGRLRALPVDLRLVLMPGPAGGPAPATPPLALPLASRPLSASQLLAKRALDLALGGLALLVVGPLIAALALLVKLDSPGPVFFRQPRRGYNGEIFSIYKFRTMYHDRGDLAGRELTRRGDKRITRIGGFLRRSSLDELPQLLNVLRGDMSLVGPRPHPLEAQVDGTPYPQVAADYCLRWRMKPGMTGWAAVNGWRGPTDTPDQLINRVRYDLEYIEHWSLAFDLFILWRTVVVCATGRNAF